MMQHVRAKRPLLFPTFLGLVFLLFIGILIYVWYGAKQAAPVILDEKGQPRDASSHSHPR